MSTNSWKVKIPVNQPPEPANPLRFSWSVHDAPLPFTGPIRALSLATFAPPRGFSGAREQHQEKKPEGTREQMQATRDELAATNQAVGDLRVNLQETARTLTGRTRLLEDRFGKMLEVVEESLASSRQGAKSVGQLFQRLERLEGDRPTEA